VTKKHLLQLVAQLLAATKQSWSVIAFGTWLVAMAGLILHLPL
jgi:hypothetical protein